MKLRFSNEWLHRKIASDPDVECEAGRPLYHPSGTMADGTTFGDFMRKESAMTTTVKVHVNGKYRATVKQDGHDPVTVEGNYNGGSGEKSFYLPHPAKATFEISEEQVADGDERNT